MNQVLYKKWETDNGQDERLLIVIPHELRPFILQQLHDGPFGGHLGIKKTRDKIRQKYFWPNMRQDVEMWCKSCIVFHISSIALNVPDVKIKFPK